MNALEQASCLDLTRRISSLSLFQPIGTHADDSSPSMVSSEQDIARALVVDWERIMDRLSQNDYRAIDEWCRSVSQAWDPILDHCSPGSLLHAIGLERQRWFEKRYLKIPHTPTDDWLLKFANASRRLSVLASIPPAPLLIDPMMDRL
jgi:hypothetical protein